MAASDDEEGALCSEGASILSDDALGDSWVIRRQRVRQHEPAERSRESVQPWSDSSAAMVQQLPAASPGQRRARAKPNHYDLQRDRGKRDRSKRPWDPHTTVVQKIESKEGDGFGREGDNDEEALAAVLSATSLVGGGSQDDVSWRVGLEEDDFQKALWQSTQGSGGAGGDGGDSAGAEFTRYKTAAEEEEWELQRALEASLQESQPKGK